MKKSPKKLANSGQDAIDKVSVPTNTSEMSLHRIDRIDRKAEKSLQHRQNIQQVKDCLAGLSSEARQETVEWISYAEKQTDSPRLDWHDLRTRLSGLQEDEIQLRVGVPAFEQYISAVEEEEITPLPPSGVQPVEGRQEGTVESIWGVYGDFSEPGEQKAG